MTKKIVIIVVGLALAIFGVFAFLITNLDDIVAKVIESEGSKVTGTQVSVSGVSIHLKEGTGTINGLTIASPEGFDPAHTFKLEGVTMDLDLGTLRDDVIVINEIRVSDPRVTAQILKDASSNIQALQKHVDQYATSKGGGGSGGADAPATDKRLRIKRFAFDGGRVELDATALGDKEVRAVDLPAFTINDIGGAAGATPDAVAKAVLAALTRQAIETVAKSGIEQKARETLKDKAGEVGKGLIDKIGG